MANTSNPNGFRAVKLMGGGAFPMFTYNTKSNLALTAGDAVIMLTNGTLDIAVSTSLAIFGVCQSTVTAVAATRKAIMVIPALPDIVFSAQFGLDLSAANPNWIAAGTYKVAGATGAMLITNLALTTSNAPCRVIGVEPGLKNAAGAYNRVLFTWARSQFTGNGFKV